MILLLLALLAPADITAAPGAEVQLETHVLGVREAQITASKPLLVDATTSANATITVRVRPDARPGTHKAYLYAAPITDEAVIAAAAHPITVHVKEPAGHELLASTRQAFRKNRWWLTPLLVILGVCLLWAVGAIEVGLA